MAASAGEMPPDAEDDDDDEDELDHHVGKVIPALRSMTVSGLRSAHAQVALALAASSVATMFSVGGGVGVGVCCYEKKRR